MAENNDNSLSLKPEMKTGAKLNRKVIIAVALGISLAILYSLMTGFGKKGGKKKKDDDETMKLTSENVIPESISTAADSYDSYRKNMAEELRRRLEEEEAKKKKLEELKPLTENKKSDIQPAKDSKNQPVAGEEQNQKDDTNKVNASKIFFTKSTNALPKGTTGSRDEDASGEPDRIKSEPFIPDSNVASSSIYLSDRIQRPISPYELTAGSIIPAALITGINSELPGQIIAQVHENIFDSVSGNYMLIPQGTRLIGSYNSGVIEGQSRILTIWNYMIFPNGNSINLDSLNAGDLAGYSGVADKVNYHFTKLFVGALLTSVLSIAPSVTQGNVEGENPTVDQAIAEDLGIGVNKTGNRIINDKFNLPPTIEIRPGYMFNVIVNKTIVLEPWQEW